MIPEQNKALARPQGKTLPEQNKALARPQGKTPERKNENAGAGK